jgi:hypothetical protein
MAISITPLVPSQSRPAVPQAPVIPAVSVPQVTPASSPTPTPSPTATVKAPSVTDAKAPIGVPQDYWDKATPSGRQAWINYSGSLSSSGTITPTVSTTSGGTSVLLPSGQWVDLTAQQVSQLNPNQSYASQVSVSPSGQVVLNVAPPVVTPVVTPTTTPTPTTPTVAPSNAVITGNLMNGYTIKVGDKTLNTEGKSPDAVTRWIKDNGGNDLAIIAWVSTDAGSRGGMAGADNPAQQAVKTYQTLVNTYNTSTGKTQFNAGVTLGLFSASDIPAYDKSGKLVGVIPLNSVKDSSGNITQLGWNDIPKKYQDIFNKQGYDAMQIAIKTDYSAQQNALIQLNKYTGTQGNILVDNYIRDSIKAGVNQNQIIQTLTVGTNLTPQQITALLTIDKYASANDYITVQLKAGVFPSSIISTLTSAGYQNVSDAVNGMASFLKALPTMPQDLQDAYNIGGLDNYNKVLATNYTLLPDKQYISNQSLNLLKTASVAQVASSSGLLGTQDSYYNIATTQGMAALQNRVASDKVIQQKALATLVPYKTTVGQVASGEGLLGVTPSYNVQKFISDNPTQTSVQVIKDAFGANSDIANTAQRYVNNIQDAVSKLGASLGGMSVGSITDRQILLVQADKLGLIPKSPGLWLAGKEASEFVKNLPDGVRVVNGKVEIVDYTAYWNGLSDSEKQQLAQAVINDPNHSNLFAAIVEKANYDFSKLPKAGQLIVPFIPVVGMPITALQMVSTTIAKATTGQTVGAMEIALDAAATAIAVLMHTSPTIMKALPGMAGKATVGVLEGGAIATFGTNLGLNWSKMSNAERIENVAMMVAIPVISGTLGALKTSKAMTDILTTKGGILPTGLKTGGLDLAYIEVPDLFKGIEGKVSEIIATMKPDEQAPAIRALLNPENQIKFDAYMKLADAIPSLKMPDSLINSKVDFSNVEVIKGNQAVANGFKVWLQTNVNDVYVGGSTARGQQLLGVDGISTPHDFDFYIRQGSKLTPEGAVQNLADTIKRYAPDANVEVIGTKLKINGKDTSDIHIEGYAGKNPFGWATLSKPVVIDGVAFTDIKQLLYDLLKPPTTPGIGESAGLLFPSAEEPFPRGKVGEYVFGTIPERIKDIMAGNVAFKGIADAIQDSDPQVSKLIRDSLYTIQTTPEGRPLVGASNEAVLKTKFLDLVSKAQLDVLNKGVDATVVDPETGGTLIRIASPASKVLQGTLYSATRDLTPFVEASKQGFFEVGKILGAKDGELTIPSDVKFTRPTYSIGDFSIKDIGKVSPKILENYSAKLKEAGDIMRTACGL